MNLFSGSPLDIYVHRLIFVLGICVFLSGLAVLLSCRSVAGIIGFGKTGGPSGKGFYQKFYKFHSIYWIIFGILLVMHLMVTITHVGLPGEPYLQAHRLVFITSIINFSTVILILLSCRSFLSGLHFLSSRNILGNKVYRKFFRFHSYLWLILIVSFMIHVVSGMIHAMNT